MEGKLPPGVDGGDLRKALDAFARVVGADWVFADETAVNSYRDPFSIVDEDHFEPSAAVAPANVEQVQDIVRIAGDYGIPLWPISTGKNVAYGGPAPRLPGSVVLDLKRMNKVLEVNEEFGYALVEPGVSYIDLYEHLQKTGSKLWIDPASNAMGGVVGNTADRGVGYTPYGDHFAMQCGMEVVLADGSVVRTGMGALPNSNTWQLFKYGFGPYLDGIFTQSNFGVITKMGIWLMPEPPGYRPYLVTFPREEDIEQVIDILRPLKVNLVIQNAATISNVLLDACIVGTRSQYYTGDGPLPPSVLKKIMADQNIGMWNYYSALYGPEPIMDATWGVIRDALSAVPGAKFYLAEDRPNDPVFEYRKKLMSGVPTMAEFNLINWAGGGGHVDFAPISPTTGADAIKQYAMIRDRSAEFGYDYIGEFIIGWREMHHIFTLVFDGEDEDRKAQAHDLFSVLIDEAAKAGYGEYRTHLEYMDQIAASYNWNDNALLKLNERLKDALDPKGILAPGKQGIWPKHLRGQKN
jgi:4-cresol dehydrogenase (hydroxylating)